MSRVLVTGARGFLGRRLVPALAEAGYAVRAAVRLPASVPFAAEVVSHGDLAEPVDWSPIVAGMESIVHLAGIAHASETTPEDRYNRVNWKAAAQLAFAAAGAGVRRLVFVSSIRAQSGPMAARALTEADEPRPTDAYGRSKLAAEQAIHGAGVPSTILRPVLIVGPGARGNLQSLERLARLPIPLPFGAFTNRRSLLGIDDFIGAVRFSLEHPGAAGETYLVAHPQPIAVADMIRAVRAGVGRPPRLVALPPAIVRTTLLGLGQRSIWDRIGGEFVADPSKLMAAGWSPAQSPRELLQKMSPTGPH